ncbi:MAG: energy-coupling factor transporter transmembrane component T family protein [Anaerolineae bacterium]
MSLVFDLYVPGRSWLHRLDPRVKLWLTALGCGSAFLLRGWWMQGLFLIGLLLLLRSASISWEKLGWIWRQMRLLVILILLLQPLFTPGGRRLAALGPLVLSTGGVQRALLLALRALALSYLAGGLLFTTEQRGLVRGLVRLGVPYTWGLTLSLTLRFLPALSDLFNKVREAQAARGWVAEGGLFRRARDYLPVLVAVVIGTLRMGDQLTLALAARGLGTVQRRTVWRELEMRPADRWVLIGGTLGFLLLLFLGRVEGWGL